MKQSIDEFIKALSQITLVNPVHLTMTSNGMGEFPDSYKLNPEGLEKIKSELITILEQKDNEWCHYSDMPSPNAYKK